MYFFTLKQYGSIWCYCYSSSPFLSSSSHHYFIIICSICFAVSLQSFWSFYLWYCKLIAHLSIFYNWGPEPIAAATETGYTLDKSPVHHRASMVTLTPVDNLESPIDLIGMFLDGGRKPEYPERTQTNTGRTYKLHTERPQLGFEPGTLLLWSDGANHHTIFIYFLPT